MRLNFSTSWIFRGWITCALVTFYAQDVISKPGSRSPRDHQRIRNTDVEWTDVISKPVKCDDNHYIKDSRCCKKCGPGLHVLTHCTDFHQTKCIKCNRGEYQPGWTEEDRCLRQKFCDQIKGFMESPENHFAEEPCRCPPHRQCHPINCEFCERIPTCSAGYGLEVDPEFTNGRKICVACKKGFFSADNIGEQCRPWTSCKAEGRTETHPGSAHADAVCGPHVSASSWVIVSVLSVITVLCLLILLLFCYKDKLKLLSVNLRSCVQNLKRTRIQQETLAPLYHSGGPKCAPCETTKLICQAPHNPTDDTPCTFLTPVPEVKVTLPFTADLTEKESTVRETVTEDQSEGSGEPEEVSEEEEEEVVSVSPLFVGSCVCVISIREPLEVGENEDCSQAVSPGTLANCSCRGLDGDGEKSESDGGKKCDGTQQKVDLSKSETVAASFVSLSPPLVHTSSTSSPLPELCLPLSQALAPQEFKPHETDRSRVKQEELYILTSTNSTETSSTSVMSSVSPLMTSSSVGDLYLDKPCDDSGPGQGQGLCWEDGSGNKLSSGDSELDCSPESLHSQLDEPTLTSGQVLGNNNTTFISSGQVMNFSGDVIVVYVSQTSVGSDGTGPDDAFGSPVQEEASEAAPVFRGNSRSRGDSTSHTTVQDETLPVHEMVEGRLMGK